MKGNNLRFINHSKLVRTNLAVYSARKADDRNIVFLLSVRRKVNITVLISAKHLSNVYLTHVNYLIGVETLRNSGLNSGMCLISKNIKSNNRNTRII